MKYPETLNSDKYNSKSQSYDDLLELGISLIQKFSGDNWTDYNHHDPGITILEQLCFAITDLGYKANFPIEDILMIGVDDYNYEKSNLFIPPNKIFTSNPSTSNDFRRLLIDSIEEINNVWIENVNYNDLISAGLFNVKLQLKDNLKKQSFKKVIDKTRLILAENRVLCSDINDLVILKKDIISIGAEIQIDSFYVGEEILANIFHEVEKRLNEKVKYVGLEFFDGKEVGLEHIYQGVETKNGIILDQNLQEKTNQIYVSEIIEIIRNIEGVINIKDFVIFKNGIKIFDEIIPFSENSYPSLEELDTFFSENSESEINFIRNNTKYSIDRIIFSQIFDTKSSNDSINIINERKYFNEYSKGRFDIKKLKKYYSIINEFPSLYGLREKELDAKSSKTRIAQMKQLKAFLLLFDQLMCNYTSQLTNIRNVFSVDEIDKTYFSQIPNDIYGLDKIVRGLNKNKYALKVEKLTENKTTFIKRRNQFLDHILSRFGESYNSNLLQNIYQNENPSLSQVECALYAINAKVTYANKIPELGRNRNRAYNYYSKKTKSPNYSGLEQRLRLLLNIENDFIDLDLKKYNSELAENHLWSKTKMKLKNGPEINIFSLSDPCYKNNRVNFYLDNYSLYKDLFLNAIQEKSFKIVQEHTGKHIILYKSSQLTIPVKIFENKSKVNCKKRIKEIISKIKLVNTSSEGFYIIENILLRPLQEDRFSIIVYDNNNQIKLKSFKPNDFKELSIIRENITHTLNDRSNYSIIKTGKNSDKYLISLFDAMDNKILISESAYNNKAEAKKDIEDIIKLISSKNEIKCEIISENKTKNKFPENFNYNNELNVIFPEWPSRFQNVEFKKYIYEIVDYYAPANIKYKVHFINVKEMSDLSVIFEQWKKLKSKHNKTKIDIFSLKIIQLLMSFNEKK